MRRPLRLLLIRDRRPGHHHQVEGVAAAIARLAPVVVDRIELRSRRFARSKARDLAFKAFADDHGRLLNLLFGIRVESLARPDAIVGSGRASFIASSLLARWSGAKFIYSGYLEDYETRHFDLMLVQSPRFAGEPKCVLTPIPCVIDPDQLPFPRPLRSIADLAGAEFSLLLGGKAKGYGYSDLDWQALAELTVQTGMAYGIRWSVSDSRRTPLMATRLFSRLAEAGNIARFVEFCVSGPGSANALFAADAIVVTEDSRSMMAEAVAARRPVIAVRPEAVAFSLATEETATMACWGGIAVLPIRTLTPDQFVRSLLSIKIPGRDPRELIAEAIAPVLGLAPEPSRSLAVADASGPA